MPLPPAPTKPADRLPAKAFTVTARNANRTTDKAPTLNVSKTASVRSVTEKGPAKSQVRKTPAILREPAPVVQPEPVAAAVAAPVATRSVARAKKATAGGPTKLFVLDTNVLMHDPMSLFRFEEHDIYLPMIVLEELDGHKKGMTEVARNARQTSRTLDALAAAPGADIAAGFDLASTGHRDARGRVPVPTQPLR